jgi:hypothetical protein
LACSAARLALYASFATVLSASRVFIAACASAACFLKTAWLVELTAASGTSAATRSETTTTRILVRMCTVGCLEGRKRTSRAGARDDYQ